MRPRAEPASSLAVNGRHHDAHQKEQRDGGCQDKAGGGKGMRAEKGFHRISFIPRLKPSNVMGTIFPSKILRMRSVDWV